MDICFVPASHLAPEPLPAVSGSSGRLVVARPAAVGEAPAWPGQVFAQDDLPYEEAMRQYSAATRDRLAHLKQAPPPEARPVSAWRQQNLAQAERYRLRQQRQQEDRDWQMAKADWRAARQSFQHLPRQARPAQQAAYQAAEQTWHTQRQAHQEQLDRRRQEDRDWHQHHRERRGEAPAPAPERRWIAILVATDNCSRQCVGLPVFESGPNLTSAELVQALGAILPEELAFLISDQGASFRSVALAQLAQEAEFIHIPVYRHRPQSNGIAERLVLTLKTWLSTRAWQNTAKLEAWLAQFIEEYNQRPHQGLAIPGLSPNEFAQRIWLM